jgi:hypothetical protein
MEWSANKYTERVSKQELIIVRMEIINVFSVAVVVAVVAAFVVGIGSGFPRTLAIRPKYLYIIYSTLIHVVIPMQQK